MALTRKKSEEILFRSLKNESDDFARSIIGLYAESDLPEEIPDLNAKDEDGNTLLHYAVKRNLVRCVNRLLEKGANPNIQDNNNCTPLIIAVINVPYINSDEDNLTYRHYDIIESLVKNGSDITARDQNGDTCLHLLIRRNNYFALKSLLSNCGDFSCLMLTDKLGFSTPFHQAVYTGKILIVDYLLKEIKIDPNLKNPNTGKTALHHAAQDNQPSMIKMLVEAGADINAKDNFGYTPLRIAIKMKYTKFAEELEKCQNSANNQQSQNHFSANRLFKTTDINDRTSRNHSNNLFHEQFKF